MLVPVLVFLVCFLAVGLLSAYALPRPAPTRLGALAFWTAVGLLALAAAVAGCDIDALVRSLQNAGQGGDAFKQTVLAEGLASTGRDAGPLAGIAVVVLLLGARFAGSEASPAPQPGAVRV